MMLCRVAMGAPFLTDRTHSGERRPPLNEQTPGAPFDSIFAERGVANGAAQVHNEYVVFTSDQAYPEYLVYYTVYRDRRVNISGATGGHAGTINGRYHCNGETSGGAEVYVKVGGTDACIWYFDGAWHLGGRENLGTGMCYTYAYALTGQEVSSCCNWQVWVRQDGGWGWEEQHLDVTKC
jgi:hypothetical protein